MRKKFSHWNEHQKNQSFSTFTFQKLATTDVFSAVLFVLVHEMRLSIKHVVKAKLMKKTFQGGEEQKKGDQHAGRVGLVDLEMRHKWWTLAG